ncbi:U3 snoRNP protein [Rhizophlyctis rosea]|nr:U3 snoRNP protein [Rhizophlyctis rosea]
MDKLAVRELNTTEGSNRFRFAPFRERVKNVKIDVVHRLVRGEGEPDENDSHFKQCLERWTELNITITFTHFVRAVRPYTLSLVQILYHKDKIVTLLASSLDEAGSLAYEPLLELCTALAKDLQEEFYPHFPTICSSILKMLSSPDIKVLEAAFSALAYQFKYLWKELLLDIIATYQLLEPYLKDNKPFIRRFAAEAFGFLLRKVKGQAAEMTYRHIVQSLRVDSRAEYCEGVSLLFYETIKSVKDNINSSAKLILQRLLEAVLDGGLDEDDVAYDMARKTHVLIGHHVAKEHAGELWDYLMEALKRETEGVEASRDKSGEEKEVAMMRLGKTMGLAGILVGIRKGKKLDDRKPFYAIASEFTRTIFSMSDVPAFTLRSLREFQTVLLLTSNQMEVVIDGTAILDQVFALKDEQYVLAFCDTLAATSGWEPFPDVVLPKVFSYIQTNFSRNPPSFLLYLNNLFTETLPSIITKVPHLWKTQEGLIKLAPGKGKKEAVDIVGELIAMVSKKRDWKGEALLAGSVTIDGDGGEDTSFGVVTAAMTCLEHVASPFNVVFNALRDLLVDVVGTRFDVGDGKAERVLKVFSGEVLGALTRRSVRAKEEGRLSGVWEVVMGEGGMVEGVRGVGGALGRVAEFLEALRDGAKDEVDLSVAAFEKVYPLLKDNVGSMDEAVRQSTLRILVCYEQLPFRPVKDSAFHGPCTILQLCLSTDQIPSTLAHSREKAVLLRRLDTMTQSRTIPPLYADIPTLYSLAVFSIPFTPMWAEATKVLCSAAQAGVHAFWKGFYARVKEVKERVDGGGRGEGALGEGVEEEVDGEERDGGGDGGRKKKEDGKFGKSGLAFNCPSLDRIYGAGERAGRRYGEWRRGLFVAFCRRDMGSESRLDYMKYYAQLIRTLTLIPHLVESESKSIVPLFLELFRDERGDAMAVDAAEDEQPEEEDSATHTPKMTRSKIVEFLGMFAKVRHPTRLHEHERLYDIYMGLLTKGEDKLQSLALDCILTWRQPGVVLLEESLRSLADHRKFRDALSTLDITAINDSLKITDRPEAMKVLMNVLYGKLISRHGLSSRAERRGRRAAIFAFLTGVEDEERGYVVELMVRPFAHVLGGGSGEVATMAGTSEKVGVGVLKRYVGFLTVLEDMVKQFRHRVVPFLRTVLEVVMFLVGFAERELVQVRGGVEGLEGDEGDDDAVEGGEGGSAGGTGTAILKDIRTSGIRRLSQIFEADLEFDFRPYVERMFGSFIAPRIPLLGVENTQAPSALLGLFGAWSRNLKYVGWLNAYSAELMPKLLGIMSAKKVRDPVISAVLKVVENVIQLGEEYPEEGLVDRLLKPHVDGLLGDLDVVLSGVVGDKGRPVWLFGNTVPARVVGILAKVSVYVTETGAATKLLELLLPFLKRPTKSVPEGLKTEMLKILTNFLPILEFAREGQSPVGTKYFGVACQMFASLSGREGRDQLVELLRRFAEFDGRLVEVAGLVGDLNAWSVKRMDEPDFDRRFDAFTKINRELYVEFSADQWLPVLHNFIFYCQDEGEFSIRSSASHGLCQFVKRTAELVEAGDGRAEEMMNMIRHAVFPAIKRALKINSMVVRGEFVGVLNVLVKTFPTSPMFSDMVGLLAEGDEEANFFLNVYHLQTHRRLKALRRLAEECTAPSRRLRPTTVANIFIPIVAHFIFESDKVADHNLINEAIASVAACAEVLTWGHYYGVLKRFLNALVRRPNLEKAMIRVIIRVLERFHFEMVVGDEMEVDGVEKVEEKREVKVVEDGKKEAGDGVDKMEVDGEASGAKEDGGVAEEEEEEEEEEEVEEVDRSNEMEIDGQEAQRARELAIRVHDTVMRKLLPELQTYLARKDDESIPIRIPIAIAITQLLQKLPAVSINIQLPKLLITLCNLLRSRGQEIRDVTRDTLVKIALMLGAAYIPFILKELEGALTRGYQLHVLGYTVHSLLANVVPTVQSGDLDACVEILVRICVSDIFGETGNEREVEELKGKMREIKTTKSFDSFELIAKIVSFRLLDILLLPIKELMLQTDNVKVVRQIEEVFRKIALGVNGNPSVEVTELMIFVHGLVTENLPIAQAGEQAPKKKSATEQQHLVQLKRNDPLQPLKVFQANAHLFIEFGLSLLLTALKREQIDVRDQTHLQMLDPLTSQIGRALYSKHSTVCINAIRILSILAKTPLPKLRETMPVIIKRIFEIVARSLSTSAEIVQAAFRLLTIVLRDCKYVEISQQQLVALLALLAPDLQEPEKQTTTFSLIRAILSRKYVVKEVYDLMDTVSQIMVTSQSAQVRDLCRGAYMQFLLDYPHGKERLRKQMTYLVNNLSYEYETGRESVLEVLNGVITKFSDEAIVGYSEMIFVALVMALVNDDSAKCREMSGVLVKALFGRLDVGRMDKIFVLLEKWFAATGQVGLQRTAVQVFGLVVEAFGEKSRKWVLGGVLERIEGILEGCEVAGRNGGESEGEEVPGWEAGYYALNTFGKIVAQFPGIVSAKETDDLWPKVFGLLLHPHQWIRRIGSRLLGILFTTIDPRTRKVAGQASVGASEEEHVLVRDRAALRGLSGRLVGQLDSELVTQELATQVVKNLFFLGKCMFYLDEEEGRGVVGEVESDEEAEEDGVADGEKMEEDGANGHANGSGGSKPSLLWLCQKLSYAARAETGKRRGPLLRKSVFQFYAAIAGFIPSEKLRMYLLPMVSTLYRTAKDETAKGADADDLRRMAKEVLELLQKYAGTAVYIEVYNRVHSDIVDVRRERKMKRDIQAVVNPEAHAKRRLQKNEMKRSNRKRKAEEFASKKVKMGINKRMKNV